MDRDGDLWVIAEGADGTFRVCIHSNGLCKGCITEEGLLPEYAPYTKVNKLTVE